MKHPVWTVSVGNSWTVNGLSKEQAKSISEHVWLYHDQKARIWSGSSHGSSPLPRGWYVWTMVNGTDTPLGYRGGSDAIVTGDLTETQARDLVCLLRTRCKDFYATAEPD